MKSKNLHVRQVRQLWWWLAPASWALALFVASSIPGTSYPEVSFAFADKLVHLCIYGVFGALLARAVAATWPSWRNNRIWLMATGLATLYGATDEFHQMFVPNRSPDVRDLMADALGAGTGAALTLLFLLWQRHRRARRV